jgi:hypothetical protein
LRLSSSADIARPSADADVEPSITTTHSYSPKPAAAVAVAAAAMTARVVAAAEPAVEQKAGYKALAV